jgi:cobalt transporter subunit CbtB
MGIEITLATDAIMQTHIIGSRRATGSRTLPRSDTLAAAVFAAILGVSVIWAVGFSHIDIAHNAAHDTRHSAGFPCHWQLWWLGTTIATGAALALIAFTTRAPWAIVAAVLIVLPHLYGAPELAEHNGAVPAALAHHFVIAATVANFLFWLILGASTGYFHERLQPQIARAARAGA